MAHGMRFWIGFKSQSLKNGVLPVSLMAEDGGFAMLRQEKVLAMLRYPRFRFRPSQADVLHLDLWIGAENILRDGGSFLQY